MIVIVGGLIIKHQGQRINQDLSLEIKLNLPLIKTVGISNIFYGSQDPSAPVVINIHGSGLDGTFEKAVNQKACDSLGVRGIAISLLVLVILI